MDLIYDQFELQESLSDTEQPSLEARPSLPQAEPSFTQLGEQLRARFVARQLNPTTRQESTDLQGLPAEWYLITQPTGELSLTHLAPSIEGEAVALLIETAASAELPIDLSTVSGVTHWQEAAELPGDHGQLSTGWLQTLLVDGTALVDQGERTFFWTRDSEHPSRVYRHALPPIVLGDNYTNTTSESASNEPQAPDASDVEDKDTETRGEATVYQCDLWLVALINGRYQIEDERGEILPLTEPELAQIVHSMLLEQEFVLEKGPDQNFEWTKQSFTPQGSPADLEVSGRMALAGLSEFQVKVLEFEPSPANENAESDSEVTTEQDFEAESSDSDSEDSDNYTLPPPDAASLQRGVREISSELPPPDLFDDSVSQGQSDDETEKELFGATETIADQVAAADVLDADWLDRLPLVATYQETARSGDYEMADVSLRPFVIIESSEGKQQISQPLPTAHMQKTFAIPEETTVNDETTVELVERRQCQRTEISALEAPTIKAIPEETRNTLIDPTPQEPQSTQVFLSQPLPTLSISLPEDRSVISQIAKGQASEHQDMDKDSVTPIGFVDTSTGIVLPFQAPISKKQPDQLVDQSNEISVELSTDEALPTVTDRIDLDPDPLPPLARQLPEPVTRETTKESKHKVVATRQQTQQEQTINTVEVSQSTHVDTEVQISQSTRTVRQQQLQVSVNAPTIHINQETIVNSQSAEETDELKSKKQQGQATQDQITTNRVDQWREKRRGQETLAAVKMNFRPARSRTEQKQRAVEEPFGTRDTALDVVRRVTRPWPSITVVAEAAGTIQPVQIRPLELLLSSLRGIPATVTVSSDLVRIEPDHASLEQVLNFATTSSANGHQLSSDGSIYFPLIA